jgi:hypothetical protein
MTEVRPTHLVTRGKRHLDHAEAVIGLGLQFEHDAPVAHAFGFQDFVVLAAAVDIGDRFTREQGLDWNKLAEAQTL